VHHFGPCGAWLSENGMASQTGILGDTKMRAACTNGTNQKRTGFVLVKTRQVGIVMAIMNFEHDWAIGWPEPGEEIDEWR
jgi:hypothetical protein